MPSQVAPPWGRGGIKRSENMDVGAEVTTGETDTDNLMAAEEHHSQITYQDPIPVDLFPTMLLSTMIRGLLLALSSPSSFPR
jgi:hypothetical protein